MTTAPAAMVRMGTTRGRLVLLATILGSGMAGLDATVVNVALPHIGTDLNASFTQLQWVVNAYTLTLAGFLLFGGALGDRVGRRLVFHIGVIWFAVASLGCAVAPNADMLIATRALQGMGGALLVPGSLAIIESTFAPEDRGAAVGAWSGLGGVATAIGPVVGGWLVQAVSWRAVFVLNLPLAVICVIVCLISIPESPRDPRGFHGLDLLGTLLAAAGLAGVTLGLTEGPSKGWRTSDILAVAVGAALLAGFVLREATTDHPLVPLSMFRNRQFSATNGVTFLVYAALGGTFFLLPQQLQRVAGFSPVEAGSSLLPLTAVMLLLSARAGRLAQRIGPRIPMSLGPAVVAVGLLLLAQIGAGSTYLPDVLPGLLVQALGLSLTVAPLTATALASAPDRLAGVASAVNNDVARVAGLIAVAVLPALGGIHGGGETSAATFSHAFQLALYICAGLCLAGGLLAALTISDTLHPVTPELTCCPVSAPAPAGDRQLVRTDSGTAASGTTATG